MTTLLIDGDLVVHRSCAAVEKDTRFFDRYHILMCDENDAAFIAEETIAELLNQSDSDDYALVFSDPKGSFRKDMAGHIYKADRLTNRKPLAYWDVKARLIAQAPEVVEMENLEADDAMGIVATQWPGAYAIWSLDKDLKQIPGLHLIDDELVEITVEEADAFFWFQVLAGDPVDGYTGCPGLGVERAKKVVANRISVTSFTHTIRSGPNKGATTTRWKEHPGTEDMWEVVVSQYRKAGLGPDEALLNARMARILRAEDYDNGVILWKPA